MNVGRAPAVVTGPTPLVSAWALPFHACPAVVERSDVRDPGALALVSDAVVARFGAPGSTRVTAAPPDALGAAAAVGVAALRLCGVEERGEHVLVALCEAIASAVGHVDSVAVGAALDDCPVVCASQHPPAVYPLATPRPVWLTAVVGQWKVDRESWRRAMPANIPTGRLLDSMRRAAALAPAWQSADFARIGELLDDRLFAPALGPQIPGFFPTQVAARQAGAFAATLASAGAALIALSADATTAQAVEAAMTQAMQVHSNADFVGTCRLGGLHDAP